MKQLEKYTLKELSRRFENETNEMDHPGLDLSDNTWSGNKVFEIEFKDRTAVINCDISKRFDRDGEVKTFKIDGLTGHFQFAWHEEPFTDEIINELKSLEL